MTPHGQDMSRKREVGFFKERNISMEGEYCARRARCRLVIAWQRLQREQEHSHRLRTSLTIPISSAITESTSIYCNFSLNPERQKVFGFLRSILAQLVLQKTKVPDGVQKLRDGYQPLRRTRINKPV